MSAAATTTPGGTGRGRAAVVAASAHGRRLLEDPRNVVLRDEVEGLSGRLDGAPSYEDVRSILADRGIAPLGSSDGTAGGEIHRRADVRMAVVRLLPAAAAFFEGEFRAQG